MNSYVIFTDSASDLNPVMARELELQVLPLKLIVNGELKESYANSYEEYEKYTKDLYSQMRAGEKCTTAAVNTGEYIDAMEPFLKEGKDILNIAFSSALSITYNSSELAVKELAEKYPERKIYTVDSLCASLGEGMLVYSAVQKKREGMSIGELFGWVSEMRHKLCHWFTVSDLMFLRRGGRISAAAALLGTKLGIKPLLHVDEGGFLVNVGKVRGRKKSLEELLDHTMVTALDPGGQTMFISHGDCKEEALLLADELKKRGAKEVIVDYVGPVIGAHAGPEVMAMFSFGSVR